MEGLHIAWKDFQWKLTGESRNPDVATGEVVYYDLLYQEEKVEGNGRILVRLAGNEVKDILKTKTGERITVIPVGLTLAFSREAFPVGLKIGTQINLSIPGYQDTMHAVEAGPLLMDRGETTIDMETEGWKTNHSIRTQAARLDYTNMRGPKIAVGINRDGELAVLTINGRIRESVGATHADMAEILKKQGMETAMGFDPGGSSTLVVNDMTMNISPYNRDYESNIYSLPPQPRAVSNAILGFIKQ
jgi:hypothetical protein